VTDKKTVVTVTIGNEEYTLRSDRAPEYTRAVAEHVDRALKEVLQVGSMVETQKAAILAHDDRALPPAAARQAEGARPGLACTVAGRRIGSADVTGW
jgi:hypothetical protein